MNNNDKWEFMYNLSVSYYKFYGNLNIKENFRTKDGISYSEDGYGLGTWICRQRRLFKMDDKISCERRDKLNSIGMIWNCRDATWEYMYNLAVSYYNYYGNLDVSLNFKTEDGINMSSSGVNLGVWINNQKNKRLGTKKGFLDDERIRKLDNIGMSWEYKGDVRWMKMFNLASAYYNHYGNLLIPISFKTNDGINFDNNGECLGIWICKQRYMKSKNSNARLTEKRENELNSIGMIWNCRDANWEYMYNLAVSYYNYYGNLFIPNNFRTLNGININKTGSDLGEWLRSQRKIRAGLKEGIMDSFRIKRLNAIGMSWDIRTSRVKIERLFIENNIDVDKNKCVLNKPYSEVYCKICFLKENNYNITSNDGVLNEIFYMSDINMQVKYNISMEELIKKYIKKKNEIVRIKKIRGDE